MEKFNNSLKLITEFVTSSKDFIAKKSDASLAVNRLYSSLINITRIFFQQTFVDNLDNNLENKIKMQLWIQ